MELRTPSHNKRGTDLLLCSSMFLQMDSRAIRDWDFRYELTSRCEHSGILLCRSQTKISSLHASTRMFQLHLQGNYMIFSNIDTQLFAPEREVRPLVIWPVLYMSYIFKLVRAKGHSVKKGENFKRGAQKWWESIARVLKHPGFRCYRVRHENIKRFEKKSSNKKLHSEDF